VTRPFIVDCAFANRQVDEGAYITHGQIDSDGALPRLHGHSWSLGR
jgi:hypothetical protein